MDSLSFLMSLEIWATALQYVTVALIGGGVGGVELIGRYRSDPSLLFRSAPAAFYVAINALAAALALYFLGVYAVPVGEPKALNQILIAGFGALAVFRTSIFTARVGGADISIGPNLLLQVVLSAVDRGVDRTQALHRAAAVTRIATGINFNKAQASLPIFCFGLMQNVSPADQEQVAQQIAKLATAPIPDEVKSASLSLILINVVGPTVLEHAVSSLGNNIK